MKTVLFCLLALFISHSELLYCQEKVSPKEHQKSNDTKKTDSKKELPYNPSSKDYLEDKSSSARGTNEISANSRKPVSWGAYIQMFLALVFILFLIFIIFYLSKGRLRKNFVGNNGIELLARSTILPKQSILILRVGPKVLIVNSHTNGSMNTLTEFTKPEDIEMILQEIEKPSNDNIFQTLLKRNEVLYDEELANPEKEMEKLEKKVDEVEGKFEV